MAEVLVLSKLMGALSLISKGGLNFPSVAFFKSTLSRKDAPHLHVLCHLQQQR